jgi:hypothetical protein
MLAQYSMSGVGSPASKVVVGTRSGSSVQAVDAVIEGKLQRSCSVAGRNMAAYLLISALGAAATRSGQLQNWYSSQHVQVCETGTGEDISPL